MAALEGLSGELACARIGDEEIAELQALNFEMRAHHARRDLPAYYRLNAQIHQAINRAARNPVLSEVYDRLNARLQALRFSSNFDTEKWDAAVRDHDAMIEALLARDGARLRRILVRHMQHKLEVVLAHLAGDGSRSGGAGTPAGKAKATAAIASSGTETQPSPTRRPACAGPAPARARRRATSQPA
jgi:DNA-binding GntR family transcriptional regulator